MIVHYPNMTGDELKRIYKLSELKADVFGVRLGLSEDPKTARHKLYTQFERRNKAVDADVEKAVKSIPDFAKHQLMIVTTQEATNAPTNEGDSVVKTLIETIQVMKEVLVKGEKQTEVMQKAVDTMADANKHIREEAKLYRKMLTDGYEAGLLQWKTKKAS